MTNVFVLCTGRCGSTTFIKAAKHIDNYSAAHESRCHLTGSARFAYPERHIEADNRLSWLLARLDNSYGDTARYVHLIRDREATAQSMLKRADVGITLAYRSEILLRAPRLSRNTPTIEFCRDLVDTVTENIRHFLRDKSQVMTVELENAEADFSRFWDWIGSSGDRDAALAEWRIRHNASPEPEDDETSFRGLARLARKLEDERAARRVERREGKALKTALEGAQEKAAATGKTLAETAKALEASRKQTAEREQALAAAQRESRVQLAALRDYGIKLERRYAQLLESRSWRATEPMRRLGRLLMRRKPAAPFVPRFATAVLDQDPDMAHGGRKRPLAHRLEDKLWGGVAPQALADLEALKTAPAARKTERTEAAWALARWHAAQGDFAQAYENVVLMRTTDPGKRGVLRCVLLEAECLTRLGRGEEARTRLQEVLRKHPGADLYLAMANSFLDGGADPQNEARLSWINRCYLESGLRPLTRHDPARGLGIDNLATANIPVAGSGDQPLISVIVPAYRAAATLPFALRGLLAQSWRNLEVIVVDDCSPDDTVAVAEAVAATDPRVRVLRQPQNRGSYAARNAGLAAATGAFITTHDADDWSHPQKLESQARHALAHPEAAATFSDWVRCGPDLHFGWLFRAWGGFVAKNMSSMMLRREAFDALGGWDMVRVGGDTDILRRAEQRFGAEAIARVLPGVPLAFALHEARSMTRAGGSHVRTMLYGVRREYLEAGAFWREQAGSDLRLDPAAPRRFPAPLTILAEPVEPPPLDLLFVGDFCFKGGAFVSTLNYIEASLAAGLAVGVFHWRRYDLDAMQALNPQVRRLAQNGQIRIVAPGESARADTVVIGYPAILSHPVDLFPELAFEHLVVVINQMAARLHSGGDAQYDPGKIRANLRDLFGTEGAWAPISGLVQRLMRADPRYPAPSDTIWVPLIDTASWCARPLRWRGGGAQPVIGRHARDHYTKWPTDAAALRGAYCAARPCTVELMGGAGSALAVLGGTAPKNWVLHDFGAMEAGDFLGRLDFFVHYPHEDYIEEFGRAVLEALATGVPTVLPPVFRETFGDAAVYAEPAGVWERIAALWADEAAYLAQAKRGRDFVMAQSDWSQFPDRLARTVVAAAADLRQKETVR